MPYLKEGSKNDKGDGRKLADLLRTGMLRPVYHGENRGWRACRGTRVYAARYREEWLHKIPHAGVRRRAKLLHEQLDGSQAMRRTLRAESLAESRKHKTTRLLRQIPCIGPVRAARLHESRTTAREPVIEQTPNH
jgi:hypothetical protein